MLLANFSKLSKKLNLNPGIRKYFSYFSTKHIFVENKKNIHTFERKKNALYGAMGS